MMAILAIAVERVFSGKVEWWKGPPNKSIKLYTVSSGKRMLDPGSVWVAKSVCHRPVFQTGNSVASAE